MQPSTSQPNKTGLIVGAIVLLLVIVIGVVAVVGRKSSSTTTATATMSMSPTAGAPAASAVDTSSVTVSNYAFSPANITVKVGTKVTWTNQDAVSHTVTSDTGTMLKSDLFARGQSFSYTFTEAGSYSYHCSPHPYMKGNVVVTN